MPRPFLVAVRVAVPVAFWVAIRTATPSGAQNPCTAPVSEAPFSGRQGSGSSKRAVEGTPRVLGTPDGHDSLKETAPVPRPLWDPFWDPFWGPLRTGSPSV